MKLLPQIAANAVAAFADRKHARQQPIRKTWRTALP